VQGGWGGVKLGGGGGWVEGGGEGGGVPYGPCLMIDAGDALGLPDISPHLPLDEFQLIQIPHRFSRVLHLSRESTAIWLKPTFVVSIVITVKYPIRVRRPKSHSLTGSFAYRKPIVEYPNRLLRENPFANRGISLIGIIRLSG
jgi:hypothetical protein